MTFEVFDRAAALRLPRKKPMVSIYTGKGAQLRLNRASMLALGIDASCAVRLLFDRARELGAIQRDPSGKEWRLSVQKEGGFGSIGCKTFIEHGLGMKEKKRCPAWIDGDMLVFSHGADGAKR